MATPHGVEGPIAFTVRLSRDQVDDIDQVARRMGMSRVNAVRMLLELGVRDMKSEVAR